MWARDSKLLLVHNILYFPGACSDFSFVWGILKFISMKLPNCFQSISPLYNSDNLKLEYLSNSTTEQDCTENEFIREANIVISSDKKFWIM